MRTSRHWMGAVLIVLLAAFAARAERPLIPSKLQEGWRENRNALLKAVDAAWVSSSGASLIDWAMCSCDPAWETSEDRKRLAVRMAARPGRPARIGRGWPCGWRPGLGDQRGSEEAGRADGGPLAQAVRRRDVFSRCSVPNRKADRP